MWSDFDNSKTGFAFAGIAVLSDVTHGHGS